VKIFKFKLVPKTGAIVVKAYVNGYKLNLLLDTGATNTVIDYNILLMSDIEFNVVNSGEPLIFETASGIINAKWINVDSFISLGIHNIDFNFATYDFLLEGIVPEYDGMLGLDFFQNNKICIDFVKSEITIS
jgi:hypothetical protein